MDASLSLPTIEEIVETHYDYINGICRKYSVPEDEWEDTIHEIIIKIITKLHTFRGHSKLSSWIYKIAVNQIIDQNRKRMVTVGIEEASAVTVEETDSDSAELKAGLLSVVTRMLSLKERQVFLLAHIFGIKSEDAGAILGITPATYRKRLERINAKLERFRRRYCEVLENGQGLCCRHVCVDGGSYSQLEELEHIHNTRHHTESIRQIIIEGKLGILN